MFATGQLDERWPDTLISCQCCFYRGIACRVRAKLLGRPVCQEAHRAIKHLKSIIQNCKEQRTLACGLSRLCIKVQS